MDQLVFQDKEQAAFFNQTFINLKFNSDSSKYDEIFKKYNIYGLPTTIILSPEGEEIDRIIGFSGKEEFVKTIKEYVAGKNTLAACLEKQKSNPGNVENIYKIAYKYSDRQANEEAIKYFIKVLELDKENKSGYTEDSKFNIASFKTKMLKDEKPLTEYIEKSANKEFIEKAYNKLIRYTKKEKNQERVLALYEEALEKFSDDTGFMNSYAWYIFKTKIADKYERGIEVAQKAVTLKPDDDGIWDTLAQLYFINGNNAEAIKAMQNAVELAPKTDSYKKLLTKYKEA